MSLYVFYTSIKMMTSNIRGMLTNDQENNEMKEKVANEIKEFKDLELKK